MNKPTVTIKPSRYQPTKAELNEKIQIQGMPEEIVKAVMKPVNIKRESPRVVPSGFQPQQY